MNRRSMVRPPRRMFLGSGEVSLLPRFALFLCGMLAVLAVGSAAGYVVMAGLAVYAWRGPRESIQALTLLALLLIINRAIAPVEVSLMRWVVLFSAFGRAVWDTIFGQVSMPRLMRPLLLFFATIFFFSIIASYYPQISLFKLLSFTIGVGTILVGFHRTAHLREYWMSWFLTLGLFILYASAPLYVVGPGYVRNGVGFQGILTHPQTYGPVVAPLTAFLTGLVFIQGNRSRLLMLGAALGWIGIYTSQSRTALLAVILSFGVTVLVGVFKSGSWQQLLGRALTRGSVLFVAALVGALIVVKWSSIEAKVTEFLQKGDEQAEVSITGALQEARGVRIEQSMENFRSSPFTGIGFGVASDFELRRLETGFLGIPVGASVEKGFMPSAVLEETGIVGAALVILLLFALIKPLLKQGSIALFWMLLACVMINAGEMVFFSVGGMGFYFWILMGFAHSYAVSGSERPLESPPVRRREYHLRRRYRQPIRPSTP